MEGSLTARASGPQAGAPAGDVAGAPTGVVRLDWIVAGLSTWLVAGFYLDLWAHSHGIVDDSFLTPFHAVLYTGAGAFAVTLGLIGVRRLAPNASVAGAVRGWLGAIVRQPASSGRAIRAVARAVPAGYAISFAGAIVFVLAGTLDLAWHAAFGFEVDVETLLSPPHLLLATAGVLMVGGPLKSLWNRNPELRDDSWRHAGPIAVSLTMLFAIFAAFTQYANPITDPWADQVAAGSPNVTTQLFGVAPDGSAQRRLIWGRDPYPDAQLAPDGRTLAFLHVAPDGPRVVIAPVDAAEPPATAVGFGEDVAVSGSGFAWSPDGRRIAFAADEGGGYDLAIVDVDAGAVTKLPAPGADLDPAWSPDGAWLAFASDRSGREEIWLVAPDGSGARQLTDTPVGGSTNPAWSPDGSAIAFATSRDGDLEVYAIGPDGSGLRNVTRSPGTDDGGTTLTWTADGTTIAYTSAPPTPYWRSDFVREGWGAAGILVHAALIAGFTLVALRRAPYPAGGLAVLVGVPALMMAPVVEQWRFVPGIVTAGVLIELLVRAIGFGRTRARDALIAFAIPATWFSAYFVTIALTAGMGWSITLWSGETFLAGVVGVLINEVSRAGFGHPRDRAWIPVG